ncbi:Beta-phosphoglucomutase [Richelia intracellularis HH01]|uniref:Beta-phosphoglucomutase n=1 Tax=Richelia intracellularis HH01 TaxID=1165094 RepID=M1X2L2_9NOST|nr:HAD family phosphatase [Richelia intracellularis]CCH67020.1 Beta-phosphoglucomutase [Richelia intracellularis HH01]
MTLKAVVFDFNGVIINDEAIHQRLIEEILLSENLFIKKGEYQKVCIGRSSRTCLYDLLSNHGRVINEDTLTKILLKKAQNYILELEKLDGLPLYRGLNDFIFQIYNSNVCLGIVSDATRKEIEFVLERSQLKQFFSVMISSEDTTSIKPETDGYKLVVQRLNQRYPQINLQPKECLAIENTPQGIRAARRVGMQVVGIANTYPFHMLQRQANWTVDYFTDLEWERIQEFF